MSGRNRCWQYYTTQNDRIPLYLNYIYSTIKNKNHTLILLKYTQHYIYNITLYLYTNLHMSRHNLK